MTGPLVTVGVPVYHGHDTLPVLLETLRTQPYENIEVLISVDNADQASAEACQPFVERDPRFRMHVQPTRLGWAGNTHWTMRNRRGDFFIYQQHDDLFSPTYITDLVDAAGRYPNAVICFSKLQFTGQREDELIRSSLVGEPKQRVLNYLRRLDWVPFRGLIRGSALDKTSGLLLSDFDPFDSLGTEHRLMAELALFGEFRFVEGPTYFKSWHGDNLSKKRESWSTEHLVHARACWVAWMIEVIVPAGKSVRERRQLFGITVERFVRNERPFNPMRRRMSSWLMRKKSKALFPLRMLRDQLKRSKQVQATLGNVKRAPSIPDSIPEKFRLSMLRQVLDRLRSGGRFDPRESLNMSWEALEWETLRRYRKILPLERFSGR